MRRNNDPDPANQNENSPSESLSPNPHQRMKDELTKLIQRGIGPLFLPTERILWNMLNFFRSIFGSQECHLEKMQHVAILG